MAKESPVVLSEGPIASCVGQCGQQEHGSQEATLLNLSGKPRNPDFSVKSLDLKRLVMNYSCLKTL